MGAYDVGNFPPTVFNMSDIQVNEVTSCSMRTRGGGDVISAASSLFLLLISSTVFRVVGTRAYRCSSSAVFALTSAVQLEGAATVTFRCQTVEPRCRMI